jgi:hypothetical protein
MTVADLSGNHFMTMEVSRELNTPCKDASSELIANDYVQWYKPPCAKEGFLDSQM